MVSHRSTETYKTGDLSYGRRLLRQGKRPDTEKCDVTQALTVACHALAHTQPNGGDQNDGVIKLDDIDGKTNTAKEACLQKCLQYQTRTSTKVTGCEVIWDQSNRGCYG